jgi:hypothetical protein
MVSLRHTQIEPPELPHITCPINDLQAAAGHLQPLDPAHWEKNARSVPFQTPVRHQAGHTLTTTPKAAVTPTDHTPNTMREPGKDQHTEPAVFRQLAIPLSAFDYLKATQRRIAADEGRKPTNSETLARILREHRAQQEARTRGAA